MEEILDPEALEAYKEVAEERGEEFKLPAGQKAPEAKEEEEPKKEEKSEEEPEAKEEEDIKKEEAEEEEVTEIVIEENKEEAEEEDEEGKEEEKTTEEQAKAVEEQIREIAVDEGLSIKEAQEKYEGRQNLVKKYEEDPTKMAKALQSTQSAYDKLKTESDGLKDSPKYDDILFKVQAEKAQVPSYVAQNRDKLIEETRQANPKKTANMDDDDIVSALNQGYEQAIDQKYEKVRGEIKGKAAQRKLDIIREVAEEDKQFIPEVKAMVDQLDDNQIVSSAFDIQDFVKYARGEKYTTAYVKQIKDEAFKRGQQEAKIVGEKRPVSQPATRSVAKPAGTAKGLSQRQINRATEMFPDEPQEKAVEFYKDIYKKELAKNSSFLAV